MSQGLYPDARSPVPPLINFLVLIISATTPNVNAHSVRHLHQLPRHQVLPYRLVQLALQSEDLPVTNPLFSVNPISGRVQRPLQVRSPHLKLRADVGPAPRGRSPLEQTRQVLYKLPVCPVELEGRCPERGGTLFRSRRSRGDFNDGDLDDLSHSDLGNHAGPLQHRHSVAVLIGRGGPGAAARG